MDRPIEKSGVQEERAWQKEGCWGRSCASGLANVGGAHAAPARGRRIEAGGGARAVLCIRVSRYVLALRKRDVDVDRSSLQPCVVQIGPVPKM